MELVYFSTVSRNRRVVLRQVIADGVFSVYAPPAFCLPQSLQFQMPTA